MQCGTISSAGRPSLTVHLSSIIDPIDVASLFSKPQPIEIELGSGDGSFCAAYARQHPERNFLGVERLLGRLRKLERKALRAKLENLLVARIEAGYLVRYLLPPAAISALHIYFPDPWPKRKHWPNRLVNREFPASAARVLIPGGTVYLRTDDAHYFKQMLAVFATHPEFQPVDTPVELAEIVTDFERGFQARGIQTLRAAYRLRTP